jgi:predicted dinucleotide-utilizing enzyme
LHLVRADRSLGADPFIEGPAEEDGEQENRGAGPDAPHETRELLISAPDMEPLYASARLVDLVVAMADEDGVALVSTFVGSEGVDVVVMSCTAAGRRKIALRLPDLTVEENHPLDVFE